MVLHNPFFLAGLGAMAAGNTWFIALRFRELMVKKPLAALSLLPLLLVIPATAMSSWFLLKQHKDARTPIWISLAGLLVCLGVQAARS